MGSYQNLLQQKITNLTQSKVIQFFVLLSIIISISIIALSEYKSIMQETRDRLNSKVISFHLETFDELSKVFEKNTQKNFVNSVHDNKLIRENFEDMLRLLRISTVENLFVITKDQEGRYYFLLDSETDEDKRANINEPFNPFGDFWDKCYEENKVQIFHHPQDQNLWISVSYPIIQNNKTVAIIGADISSQLDLTTQMNLKNFTVFFLWILILSALWFVLLYVSALYFRHKYHEGYLDSLTHLYNRKYLNDILLKRLGRGYQLFMIDIDFFKKINDTYGHDVGDYVLVEVANYMQQLTREEDSLIRYGGEEFLIYTTQLSSRQCVEYANRIRAKIENTPIIYKDIECKVTISIGINTEISNLESFADALKKADKALYEAKSSGRNCVKVAK